MSVTTVEPTLVVAVAADAARRPRRLRFRTNRVLVVVATTFVGLLVAAALLPGVLSPGDPLTLDSSSVLQNPGKSIFGTDQYGRSIYALVVHGARASVLIGLGAVALACIGGGLLGLLAGYMGGVVDMVISRVIDVLMCFPGILLALVIAAALGPSTRNLVLSVALATLPLFARVSRGQVMSLRGRLFVTAAYASGVPTRRIVFRHVLPNALAPIVVLATVSVGTSIVIAASLSYLGLGPQNEQPDWGQLLSAGQPYLSGAWWISTFPGIVVTLTVIAVSLLGDWLRDRLEKG